MVQKAQHLHNLCINAFGNIFGSKIFIKERYCLNYITDMEELITLMKKYSDEETDLIQLRGGLYALIVNIESSPEYKKQVENITLK